MNLATTEHGISLGHQVPNYPYFSSEDEDMFLQNAGTQP
jgi:hypothetical protein